MPASPDFEILTELLAPDVKWHGGDPRAEGACENRTQTMDVIRSAYEHGEIGELVDVFGADDKVVVILRPPVGLGTQEPLVANVSTFRDGKVVEMVAYANPDEALAAVGLPDGTRA